MVTLDYIVRLPALVGAWSVYLVECEDGSLYCGIAKDPQKRYAAHVAGKGAKYTRAKKPLAMRVAFRGLDAQVARRAEWRLKRLNAKQKRLLWSRLSEA